MPQPGWSESDFLIASFRSPALMRAPLAAKGHSIDEPAPSKAARAFDDLRRLTKNFSDRMFVSEQSRDI